MSLAQSLSEYIRACFTGVWVESHEQQDALTEIAGLCRRERWRLATWDIDRGLDVGDDGSSISAGQDPLAAVQALNRMASADGTAILVLQNFHRFMQSAEIVQALLRQIINGKQHRTFVVVLAPLVQIPLELEKLFVVVSHELPGREQLLEIARGIATEAGELPEGAALDTMLDSAAGLTRYEAEGAFSLALVRCGRIQADAIWDLKAGMLKKSGLMSLHRNSDDFESLGGLSALKAFCKRALLQPGRGHPLKRPRGVLLLSPPGCGKSQFCKALGKETGRPVLILDVGTLMGSLVGQTEERTRQALRIIEAMAPCVLMVDEVEKAFAGLGTSGSADSGVSARMFGAFLSWLNDHESDVFTVCTANDVSKLPPEFSRAGRFDGVFFLDLPERAEKDAIWRMYLAQYQLDRDQRLPDDAQWTGAEIKSCCRLAALLDLPLVQAAENVVPVAVTAAEAVERLRSWAGGRCLSADHAGIYRREASATTSRRRVTRDSSQN
ncbi:MAG: AAA family ATPase [Planctomycetia bacterium]|nr:AAA family ATPase [Planctomycetia bacterium]